MKRRFLAVILLLSLGALTVRAADREYQVKAGFLYSFMQFIQWPEDVFSQPNDPFVLGVYGENPFDGMLDPLQNWRVHGHPIQVVQVSDVSEDFACHMLFVSKMKRNDVQAFLASLKEMPIVTVGEQKGFAEDGGVINLFLKKNKNVGFEINLNAARDAHLTISSKLLKLAVVIKDVEP